MRRFFTIFSIISIFLAVHSQEIECLEQDVTDLTRATEKLSNYPKLSDEFKQSLGIPLNSGRPCVIDFNATWCMPCLAFAPTYNEMRTRYRGQIDMVECDVDYYRGISANYGVRSIPNILLFDAEGTPVKRFIGPPTATDFDEALQNLLAMGIEMVEADSESEWYTLDGMKAETPSNGLYIRVRQSQTDLVIVK